MKAKQIRMTVDISMTVLLPLLMAYSLIGETFHEAVGTMMFALFIIHHILNRRWYPSLFKGRYTPRRIFQTVLDLLLLVFMIVQPVSGILISQHLYTFIHLPGAAAGARQLHLVFAYWGFILICVHAGTHLEGPVHSLRRKNRKEWLVLVIISAAISAYGVYAFVKRGLSQYMFLRTQFVFFDYSEPRIFFFLDYIAMMILSGTLGCLAAAALSAAGRKKTKKKN